MGLQEDVRRPVGCHAEALGGLDKGREDFLREAFRLDLSVDDLYEDALEDGPVEDLLEARISPFVGLTGLAEQRQRVIESLHDIVDLSDGLVLPALDLGLLVCDAQLLSLEDLDRDGVAVVELDQLLLLERQLVQASTVAFGFGPSGSGFGGDELPDGFPKCCLLLLVQPRTLGMHLSHDVLDPFNRGVRIAAGPVGPDAAQTRVVVVVAAELAAVVAVAQPGTADPAVDRAVEVVAVLLGAFPAGPVGIEHALDALKGVTVNDGLVPSWPLDPVPRDDPGVVVVAQDAVYRGASHRPGWPGRCRARA